MLNKETIGSSMLHEIKCKVGDTIGICITNDKNEYSYYETKITRQMLEGQGIDDLFLKETSGFEEPFRKILVTRKAKTDFILRNLELFEKQDWHLIVRKARRELKYSDKTVNVDILNGLRNTYNEVKGKVER